MTEAPNLANVRTATCFWRCRSAASIAHKLWKKEHGLFCLIPSRFLSGSIARKSLERLGSWDFGLHRRKRESWQDVIQRDRTVSAHSANQVVHTLETLRLKPTGGNCTAIPILANDHQWFRPCQFRESKRQRFQRNVRGSRDRSRSPFLGGSNVKHLRLSSAGEGGFEVNDR